MLNKSAYFFIALSSIAITPLNADTQECETNQNGQCVEENYYYDDVWFGPGFYYGVWFDDEDDYRDWRGNHRDYPSNRGYYNHDHPVHYEGGHGGGDGGHGGGRGGGGGERGGGGHGGGHGGGGHR